MRRSGEISRLRQGLPAIARLVRRYGFGGQGTPDPPDSIGMRYTYNIPEKSCRGGQI
ncbi:MAG: hypothetical protein KAK01_05175 [Candidatus Marinimicrobia bacterium]|nr:hypothetical protein [Candidatus Neomarinimicrobiota bacterium]